jgi:hypothetical protein|tara:strand:+ start:4881 stop:5363 length:483 start_codon:yes stop_codon:yes gene_type:complete
MNKIKTTIPSKMEDYYAKNGFHIRMNINYTATVRNLVEFKKYINSPESDIDLNVFGEITKKDESVGDLFIYFLNTMISEVKGFAVFNAQFKHTYIDCKDSKETISVRTSNGKLITFSIMYNNCIDVKYHNGKEDFTIIGFHEGKTPIPNTKVTLQTILLN